MEPTLVVVGAGAAGAVIAARASESGRENVLLIEAGPDYPAALPTDIHDGSRNSIVAHDWGFRYRAASGQVLLPMPRGRVVGGSSAVNTCIALRGHPYDYDEWGLSEWTWDKVFPAFKRLETDLDIQNEWHGSDGPMPIRRHRMDELTPWQASFIEACEMLGFPRSSDQNDPRETGYAPHPMNKIDGKRMSAAVCYLTPAVRARPNLTLRPMTIVHRVRLSRDRVVGIEVETDGRIETIRAPRIVLCGGAIATPGILLRSGIGRRQQLDRMGVKLVVENPAVGARLLDHPGIGVVMVPRLSTLTLHDPLIQVGLRYRTPDSPVPNNMMCQPGAFLQLRWGTAPLVNIMGHLGKPRGAGRMEFGSADPRERPRIHGDMLYHPEDHAEAMYAMELFYRLASTRPMKKLAHFFWPPERAMRTAAGRGKWLWRICGSGYHPSGSVPMGSDHDPGAALDQHGRVRGVSGLHVADASIFPTIPSSNTHLPTIMVGERFGAWFRDGNL
jgi:choline dehydrogenase